MAEIRKAQKIDINTIMSLYETARCFMKEHGNPEQWGNEYPRRELIEQDIASGNSYVCVEAGEIAAVFYFDIGDEPSYRKIENGEWLNDKPYGVIHRIASKKGKKGIASFCLQWCMRQCQNIRIDTHRDNLPMQNLLDKNEYQKCGIIYLADGSERIAFQKTEREAVSGV